MKTYEINRILRTDRGQALNWQGSCFWKSYEHDETAVKPVSFLKKQILLFKVKQNAKRCGFKLWREFTDLQ